MKMFHALSEKLLELIAITQVQSHRWFSDWHHRCSLIKWEHYIILTKDEHCLFTCAARWQSAAPLAVFAALLSVPTVDLLVTCQWNLWESRSCQHLSKLAAACEVFDFPPGMSSSLRDFGGAVYIKQLNSKAFLPYCVVIATKPSTLRLCALPAKTSWNRIAAFCCSLHVYSHGFSFHLSLLLCWITLIFNYSS